MKAKDKRDQDYLQWQRITAMVLYVIKHGSQADKNRVEKMLKAAVEC